eukprot:COSAG01_NODE_1142_length_11533_cov_9.907381_15_plen_109_part_00
MPYARVSGQSELRNAFTLSECCPPARVCCVAFLAPFSLWLTKLADCYSTHLMTALMVPQWTWMAPVCLFAELTITPTITKKHTRRPQRLCDVQLTRDNLGRSHLTRGV